MLILRFPRLAQLPSKSRNRGSVTPPARSHLYSYAISGLQPALAGEVPLLISLLNLPGVQPSLRFIHTLETEMYEEK